MSVGKESENLGDVIEGDIDATLAGEKELLQISMWDFTYSDLFI